MHLQRTISQCCSCCCGSRCRRYRRYFCLCRHRHHYCMTTTTFLFTSVGQLLVTSIWTQLRRIITTIEGCTEGVHDEFELTTQARHRGRRRHCTLCKTQTKSNKTRHTRQEEDNVYNAMQIKLRPTVLYSPSRKNLGAGAR